MKGIILTFYDFSGDKMEKLEKFEKMEKEIKPEKIQAKEEIILKRQVEVKNKENIVLNPERKVEEPSYNKPIIVNREPQKYENVAINPNNYLKPSNPNIPSNNYNYNYHNKAKPSGQNGLNSIENEYSANRYNNYNNVPSEKSKG